MTGGVRSKLSGLLDLGIWTFGLLEFGLRPGRLKKFLLDLDFWTSGAREFGLLDFWTFGPRLGRLRKIYWTWTFGPGPGPLDLDLSTWTWACGPGRLGLRAYWARHKSNFSNISATALGLAGTLCHCLIGMRTPLPTHIPPAPPTHSALPPTHSAGAMRTPHPGSHADSTPREPCGLHTPGAMRTHMLISSYPHILICSYPHILICSYPHILISTYPQPQPLEVFILPDASFPFSHPA